MGQNIKSLAACVCVTFCVCAPTSDDLGYESFREFVTRLTRQRKKYETMTLLRYPIISHDRYHQLTSKCQDRDPDIFRCKYLKTVTDRGSVPKDQE